jgi:hypothetical protein
VAAYISSVLVDVCMSHHSGVDSIPEQCDVRIGGDEWSVLCPSCYTHGKEPLEVACVPELVWMFLQRETSPVLANIEP